MKIHMSHETDVEVTVTSSGFVIGKTLVTYSYLLTDPAVVAAIKRNLCSTCDGAECAARGCQRTPTSILEGALSS